MTLLVTGGAGFIGSNFVMFMLRRYPEYRIVNLDKLTYAGNLENLTEIQGNLRHTFLQGDICDAQLVYEILERYHVDAIVNFAAESHVDRSILEAIEFVRTNVEGTGVLLEAAKRHRLKKFLQVSTDEVYGSLGPEGKFVESTPLHPNSPYASSKASADLLALAYHHTFGLPIMITRCSNNYGPYQFPEKLIPLMILNAMTDKPLPVYGDGGNIRDWIHVDDHCAAIDLVLHEGKDGETYNIGGNTELRNIDVVRRILKHLNKPESLIQFVEDRPGHDRRYAMDAGKMDRELGWTPRKPFDEGIVETVEWYRRNEEWWKRIVSGEYQQYYKMMYGERGMTSKE
ncbi:MAG: dTDP-glucose 4,6-dehydratase [Ignavibacteria bacterium]|nr:dTDP-glucose 4,6-dehydratase [Ignavibacteria bacterium]